MVDAAVYGLCQMELHKLPLNFGEVDLQVLLQDAVKQLHIQVQVDNTQEEQSQPQQDVHIHYVQQDQAVVAQDADLDLVDLHLMYQGLVLALLVQVQDTLVKQDVLYLILLAVRVV
jgi:hypothetical protein